MTPQISPTAQIEQTKVALENSGFDVSIVADAAAALAEVERLIPQDAQVMQMVSQTLEQAGISKLINESGKYNAVRPQLNADQLSAEEKMAAANLPEYAVGSVHAVTATGQLVIASNTGSQLPAYVYGAGKVIFVVGAQKLVGTLDDAFARIYDYVLPLESERVKAAYGMERSNVSKLLIINREIKAGRIHVVLVGESLGF